MTDDEEISCGLYWFDLIAHNLPCKILCSWKKGLIPSLVFSKVMIFIKFWKNNEMYGWKVNKNCESHVEYVKFNDDLFLIMITTIVIVLIFIIWEHYYESRSIIVNILQ